MQRKPYLTSLWILIKKYNVIPFLFCYIPCFLWVYSIKVKLNGPFSEPESAPFFSAFIAIFPAFIILSMVSFFRQQSSTYWLKPLVQVIVLAARVDGEITDKDKKIMFRAFKGQLGSAKIKKAMSYLDSIAKNPDLDLDDACNTLLKVFDSNNAVILLDVVVKVALSDQYLSAKEEAFLNTVCKKLGLPASNLASILARRTFVSENNRKQEQEQVFRPTFTSLQRYYQILGLSESANFDEVKKAYRELAKIYHPDKIRDKDLKENAKRQFQEVTEAYNAIKDRVG